MSSLFYSYFSIWFTILKWGYGGDCRKWPNLGDKHYLSPCLWYVIGMNLLSSSWQEPLNLSLTWHSGMWSLLHYIILYVYQQGFWRAGWPLKKEENTFLRSVYQKFRSTLDFDIQKCPSSAISRGFIIGRQAAILSICLHTFYRL